MTPNEISNLAAEEVFRTIERTKRINKGEIAEAIEKVLLKNPMGYDPVYGTPTFLVDLAIDKHGFVYDDSHVVWRSGNHRAP